ncbi:MULTISPECIES: carbohydrate kinase [unclassified Synechocystis]|uniref:carbohydrate kinase family protein n=1 Tax=unclassified Synechocystis TaxID=2640012 RepID=UPI00040A80FF|nr:MULTISPECIES: carbohydrate kinase [unclassified Synechocystis]AIE73596.1 Fructokinase [Synechocystis sp. PCC 6714]MCT0254962.1 carbohydrate kinase [Synechocystis sp. CS-94]
MATAQVLCFGEMLFDCLADQLGQPLESVHSWTNYPGGAPANVACALVKQGVSSTFIGRLGMDRAGQELKSVLQRCQVNLDGLQIDPQRPTRLVYVTRTLDGDRHFAGFGQYSTGDFADTAVDPSLIPESLFASAQYLVMGTIALAYPDSRAATERIVAFAEQHQVKIFLDINWRSVFWQDEAEAKERIQALIPQAEILKCTDEEAVWLFGRQDPVTIHDKFPHLQGVLVTAGEKGCAYSLGENYGEIPAFKVNVQDTTGAGDNFVAGFLAQALTHGEKLFTDSNLSRQAVTYASAMGALTTLHPGAIAK